MRIAIANESPMAIELLREIISETQEGEIAWMAYNCMQAIEHCQRDTPDLLLMDLNLSGMGTKDAIGHIMKKTPCAIVIVTNSENTDDTKVFEAMGLGAVDVVHLPNPQNAMFLERRAELVKKIETIARLVGKAPKISRRDRLHAAAEKIPESTTFPPLVVIGSSTGGPMALAKILSQFNPKMRVAFIVIQHVDEKFAAGLAHWLSEQTALSVQIATSGCRPTEGVVLVGGKNQHLVMVRNCQLKYSPYPVGKLYSPSIDELFKSVAQYWPNRSVAVLLTGMGSDGAQGLKALREAGWYTIAEHEDSCVVYGMPKAAVEAGAAQEVMHTEQIAPAILAYLSETYAGKM